MFHSKNSSANPALLSYLASIDQKKKIEIEIEMTWK
jgi:hypothetical protein